jgi:hypothetical protein
MTRINMKVTMKPREQEILNIEKVLGFSLPKENIEFLTTNIRTN